MYKNLTMFARKFDVFYKKICQVLQENLTIFVEKFSRSSLQDETEIPIILTRNLKNQKK